MCVTALSLEDLGAPGATVPFLLEPILLELEGGHYVGPILPMPLAGLASGRRGGDSSGSGGSRKVGKGDVHSGGGGGRYGGKGGGADRGGASGGGGGSGSTARVRVRYDAHLPALSLQDGEKLRTILAGTAPPTVKGHVLCNNWHLCELSLGDYVL